MGMAGGIFAAIFGVFWCIAAGAMGAWFMIPFGLIFIGMALYNAKYHHHNVTSEDRYSLVDIVDITEETDPLNEKYGRSFSGNQFTQYTHEQKGTSVAFCPYCGASVASEFDFCPKCGKKLPD